MFCVPQSVETKETNPTRPGSPTPCKEAPSYCTAFYKPPILCSCTGKLLVFIQTMFPASLSLMTAWSENLFASGLSLYTHCSLFLQLMDWRKKFTGLCYNPDFVSVYFSNLHYVLYTSLLVSESDEFVLKHHSSESSRSSGNGRKSPFSRHESNLLFTIKTNI